MLLFNNTSCILNDEGKVGNICSPVVQNEGNPFIKEFTMFKMLEKLIYAGVGAAAVTEGKAREIVSELEKKGHLTSEEASKLVKELVEKGKQASEDIRKTASTEVKRMMDKVQLVRKEDFDALAKEVRELNAKIDVLLSRQKE